MRLRYMFIDMNAFFASVEQHDFPELRGKPVAVAAVGAETTACIAASYEAKKFGIKTGTLVRDARRLCPGIVIRPARPRRYVEIHEQICQAVESVLPIFKVMSIDEMACKIGGVDALPENAARIACQVKQALRTKIGPALTCSIGISSNRLIAKIAADMQKPDGLTIVPPEELPGRLFRLKLTDFPGIGPRMERRFWSYGISTVEQMYALNLKQMSIIFGSKLLGEAWYYKIRGEDVYEAPTQKRVVSQSRVLQPDRRNVEGAEAIFVRLLTKACTRIRKMGYLTRRFSVQVKWLDGPAWRAEMKLEPCQDTPTLLQAFFQLWKQRPQGPTPYKIALQLSDVQPVSSVPRSLFEEPKKRDRISRLLDDLHREFGIHAGYYAKMHGAHHEAPVRIAFNHIPDLKVG